MLVPKRTGLSRDCKGLVLRKQAWNRVRQEVGIIAAVAAFFGHSLLVPGRAMISLAREISKWIPSAPPHPEASL